MARKPLRRLQVFDFIIKYKQDNDGLSPTYQVIGDHFHFTPQTAWDHVQGLERDGRVTIDPADRRIRVVNGVYTPPTP